MVRPAAFGYNEQTALTNAFQNKQQELTAAQSLALQEFDTAVSTLRSAGVKVTVFEDTENPVKPDAVFPNNWISLHANGTLVLYPMCTPNRRTERRKDIVEALCRQLDIQQMIDVSVEERHNRFLEGTGSIVFDHNNKIAYACLSPRTDKEVLEKLCALIGYEALCFYAHDKNGREIYHTNVMMCITEQLAIICLSSISDKNEKQRVLSKIHAAQLEVIYISFAQMVKFAGNMLGLKSTQGDDLLVLSQTAFDALTQEQRDTISRYAKMIPLAIPTIETIGGGSARCMLAEVFSSPKP
jgi:hypothetical protein